MEKKELAKGLIKLYESIKKTELALTNGLESVWEGNGFIAFDDIHGELLSVVVEVFGDPDSFYEIVDTYDSLEYFDISILSEKARKELEIKEFSEKGSTAYRIPMGKEDRAKYKKGYVKFKNLDEILDFYDKKWDVFNKDK